MTESEALAINREVVLLVSIRNTFLIYLRPGQIDGIGEDLFQFRDHLKEFTRRSEMQETLIAQLNIENGQLKSEKLKLINSVKWLSNEKHQFQRQLESHRSDMDRIVDARNAAFRKLHYAYKVIRDLVNDDERLQKVSDLGSSYLTEDDEAEGKRRVLKEVMAINVSSGSSGSSVGTARQHQLKNLKRCLETANMLGLRVHGSNNLVFLNDPMFLEERAEGIKKTYVLDWGVEALNTRLESYISSRETPLHIFVFLQRKKRWYYVGGHNCRVAQPLIVWETMGKQSKIKVMAKLLERNPGQDEVDINAQLEDGRLSQFCVEISSNGLWQESREFALRMGYQSRWD
ncbi:hypothetical protein H0H87_007952 [Tephrocybe sp. NHM501043]|nr:hypothetical protein H0H87_007952 [Tephrocybe sp. NHM501043]